MNEEEANEEERTADTFKERADRADMDVFWQILALAGSEEPQEGDEIEEVK